MNFINPKYIHYYELGVGIDEFKFFLNSLNQNNSYTASIKGSQFELIFKNQSFRINGSLTEMDAKSCHMKIRFTPSLKWAIERIFLTIILIVFLSVIFISPNGSSAKTIPIVVGLIGIILINIFMLNKFRTDGILFAAIIQQEFGSKFKLLEI